MGEKPVFRDYDPGTDELSTLELNRLKVVLNDLAEYALGDLRCYPVPCHVNRVMHRDEYLLEINAFVELTPECGLQSQELTISVGETKCIGEDVNHYLLSNYCLSFDDTNNLNFWMEYYLMNDAKKQSIKILDPPAPTHKDLKKWSKKEKQMLNNDNFMQLTRLEYTKIMNMIEVVLTEDINNNTEEL